MVEKEKYPVLEGKYARLLPMSLEHAEKLLSAANISRETFRFTQVPKDLISMQEYIRNCIALRDKGEAVPFVTIDRSSGQIIGSTRFMTIERWFWPDGHSLKRHDDSPDAIEIGGTWISEPFQRTVDCGRKVRVEHHEEATMAG